MHVNDNLLREMLGNVADPGIRERYELALSGKYAWSVYCMAPKNRHKPGKLIGYIDHRGRCIEELTTNKKGEIIAGLASSRDRFDGLKGFSCYCGNSSIVAAEESDTVKPGWTPNRGDMEKIWHRLQKRGGRRRMPLGGVAEYDGFRVEQNRS